MSCREAEILRDHFGVNVPGHEKCCGEEKEE